VRLKVYGREVRGVQAVWSACAASCSAGSLDLLLPALPALRCSSGAACPRFVADVGDRRVVTLVSRRHEWLRPAQVNACYRSVGRADGGHQQSLVGCVQGLKKLPNVGKFWAREHGVRGIVSVRLRRSRKVSKTKLEHVAVTPSSALLSSRDKPTRHTVTRFSLPSRTRRPLLLLHRRQRLVRHLSHRQRSCQGGRL